MGRRRRAKERAGLASRADRRLIRKSQSLSPSTPTPVTLVVPAVPLDFKLRVKSEDLRSKTFKRERRAIEIADRKRRAAVYWAAKANGTLYVKGVSNARS